VTARPRVPGGIIAVLRLATTAHAETAVRGLAATDVDAIELTLTTPGAVAVLARLRESQPAERVLAGTVRTVADVRACHAAGVGGIVSPHLDPALVETAVDLGLAVVPGALTPSEIVAAHDLGASAVKVFPVGLVGGAAYVKALREPLPDIPLVLSGGIRAADVAGYRAAGCHAICMGGGLLDGAAIERGDVDGVTSWAQARLDESRQGDR
jgi:2-dehydro-3-deoxyphosphogluconate aldolase / (4S)-4-hydroxy-2-oxoglutarate aldolase